MTTFHLFVTNTPLLTIQSNHFLQVVHRLGGKQHNLTRSTSSHHVGQDLKILLSNHVLCRHDSRSLESCHSSFLPIPTAGNQLQRLLLRLCSHQLGSSFSLRTKDRGGTDSIGIENLLRWQLAHYTTFATLPRDVITSRMRSPSARSTSARRIRSLLICFSITFLMSSGGRMFWISTRVIVTPHRSASRWIYVKQAERKYLLQKLLVDGLSWREGIIERDLGDDVSESSLQITPDTCTNLRQKLNGIRKIHDIEDGRFRIRNAEIHKRINVRNHVILCNDLLLSKIKNVFSHIYTIRIHDGDTHVTIACCLNILPIHGTCILDDRDNEVNSGFQYPLHVSQPTRNILR